VLPGGRKAAEKDQAARARRARPVRLELTRGFAASAAVLALSRTPLSHGVADSPSWEYLLRPCVVFN
jgi:hypothetical protein